MQKRLLIEQYRAPGKQATATELAQWAGIKGGHSIVNSQYGRLGRLFCESTGERPDIRKGGVRKGSERLWSILSAGWDGPNGFVWQMLPAVAEALEQLGWVNPTKFESPDEVRYESGLTEGAVSQVTVNAYERNPKARQKCIEHYGSVCCICNFDFGEVYGDVAEGYIHVHHIVPLSEIACEYMVDPINDLRPVCPNCHAVLHQRNPAYSIDEVKLFLQRS